MRFIILFLVFVLSITSGFSQKEKKRVRQGNTEYSEGNYPDAEKEYRKALMEKPGYVKGIFNLGDAMYEQENYEESNKLFTEVVEREATTEQKADAYYNLGNTFMNENKFQESIDAYKNSLRLNPDNTDAKYNLEYARKKLKEQQQQQNQEKNQDQDKKDQDKKDQDKKDQDKKDQDKKDQDKKDQNKKDQDKDKENKGQDKNDQDKRDQNNGDQKKDQQQKQEPQQISKQDAQRMLDALNNDEKKTLQKLQKQKAKSVKGKKSDIDW